MPIIGLCFLMALLAIFLGRIQEAAKAFYINLLLFSIGHGVYWKFFKYVGERQVSGTNFLYTGDNSYTVQGW